MNDTLYTFISHARGKGMDHNTIQMLLRSAGWKEKDIAKGIASEGLNLPVPQPVGARNARDAFLYLLTFTALYVVVCGVIVLFYTYLDYMYPDPAWGDWTADMALDTIRYAIAAILVGFPLYAFLTFILERAIQKDPDQESLPTRRWLIYLTLFLAAAISLGDVITLLFYFLDGALTTRFVLKAIVLLVIAEVVLSYYLVSPRPATLSKPNLRLRRFLAACGVLLIAGSVTLGFAMAGSPVTARLHRLDEKRVEDLRAIHRDILAMTTRRRGDNGTLEMTRALPKTLEEIAEFQAGKEAGHRLDLVDPETGEQYAYTVTGETTYELCATFRFSRDKKHDMFWNHPEGKHCYQFNTLSPP